MIIKNGFVFQEDVPMLKISYPSKQQIKKGIGISSTTTIEGAISTLLSMEMIYVRTDMLVENSDEDGIYVPTRNVFALNGEELIGDAILVELERIYNKKVYNKDDVPGKIKYLTKEKGWWIIGICKRKTFNKLST